MSGTWELLQKTHENPRLVLRLENGHAVIFELPADSPIVQGIRSALKMKREEPA